MCMGGGFELERLADLAKGRARATDRMTSRTTPQANRRLDGAELIQRFGTGDDLVLQLNFFEGRGAVFAFRFGCCVIWNQSSSGMSKQEFRTVTRSLREFVLRPVPEQDIEEEEMQFVMKKKRRSDNGEFEEEDDDGHEDDAVGVDGTEAVKQDQIILSTSSPFERLAHSYALAQSVRLSAFETVVHRSIANTRNIPETMAATGEVRLEAKELSKQMGELLMLRCDVNLHCDILDTPEIFWDEDKFEPIYISSREYQEIDKRVEILNQRLGVLKDLYDLLQNGLNVKHGNKLEWIIIILILVEVVFEFLELLHDAWTK